MGLTDGQLGLIGSGASAVSGLVGGIISSKRALQAQRETNEMNYKINQMNNDFNAQMMQKQMDFSLDMWNRNNAYNSASEQRKRLEAAGLNPYMMMDGGSAGTATNQMSTSAASAASPIPMQANGAISAAQSLGQSIGSVGNAVRNMLDMQRMASEARSAGTDADNRPFFWNDFFLTRGVQRGLMNSQASFNLASRDMTRRNLDLLNANFDQYVAQQFYQTQQMQHLTAGVIFENLIKSKDLQYYDANAITSLSEQVADIALKWSQKSVNEQQVKKLIADTAVSWATQAGIKIKNKIADIEHSILEAVKQYRIDYEKFQNDYIQLGIEGQRTQNELLKRYGDDRAQAEIFGSYTDAISRLIGTSLIGIGTLRLGRGKRIIGFGG